MTSCCREHGGRTGSTKILLIDNDPRVLDTLAVGLRFQWADAVVTTALDGESGLRSFRKRQPDLVVLDAALPLKSGYEVLMEIRQMSNVPVVMLAATGGDAEEIHGFEMGADIYLRKPVSYLVLLARIKALLRRANMPPITTASRKLKLGELSIDMQRQQVAIRGQQIKLTPVEFRLLCHLARHRGKVVSHQTLIDQALGLDKKASSSHLKVFISRLRAKIEQKNGPRYIETVRRVGYRFIVEEE